MIPKLHFRLVFVSLLVGASGLTASAAPPNVLLIIIDDLTTTLSSHRWPAAKTPHLDQLAGRGIRFERAYCQFSVCNPARQSFLTGCYPQKTKVFDLSTSFRVALPDVTSLPQHFRNHGYQTGSVGKVFHIRDPKTQFDIQVGSFLQSDQKILREEKAGNASDPPRDLKHVYNKPYAASDRSDDHFTDHQIANAAIEAMQQMQGKPFFLMTGFIRPHTPYVAPRWAFDAIDRESIELPAFYRNGGEDVSKLPRAALRPNNNAFRYEPATWKDALDAQHAYLAAVNFVDHQVGRLMAELDRLGLTNNTLIVVTGDHGYQLGEHGLWAKQTLFEGGNHVPLFFAGPRIESGVSKALVEQVDIYPTLCELIGLPIPSSVQGVSLVPWINDPATKSRVAAFSTMTAPIGPGKRITGHSARNGRFRYIQWDGGKAGEMLYDLIEDPSELDNLAGRAEHAAMQRRLRRLIQQHLHNVSN